MRKFPTMLILGVAIAFGMSGCDKIKSVFGLGATADFRNGQIDVADTSCSDGAKLSTLALQNGHYQLGGFDFSMQGDVKQGDVFGRTQPGTPDASVFVANCVTDGEAAQVLFVYGADENGKPKRLAATDLSDEDGGRADSFSVQDGTIVVEQNQGGALTKTTYALLNGRMTNLTTGDMADAGGAGTDTISFEVFHDKLQPYGQWIEHPRWGTAWHPSERGFKPYENGHWEDSDEYGTVWVSNDPWGEVPTHYGRWGYDPSYGGWLWVPGYVWGPSWVIWRASDQYVGWFPMPPGDYDGEGEYLDRWADWYGYRGYLASEAAFFGLWTFVAAEDVYAVNVRTRIVDRGGYGRFIARSRAWTHYGISHGHVVSRGLDKARFRDTFHRAAPSSHHDFKGHGAKSVKAGHTAQAHDRAGGRQHGNDGGNHGMRTSSHGNRSFSHGGQQPGRDDRFAGSGGSRHSDHGNSRSQHNGGFAGGASQHNGGFSRSNGGFGGSQHNGGSSRSNGSGFSRSNGGSGGYQRNSGFSRSNGGGGSAGGYQRNSGFSRSNGGGGSGGGYQHNSGFSRSNGGGGGGGGFQRNGGYSRPSGGGNSSFGGGGGNRSGGGGGFGGFNRGGGGGGASPRSGASRPAPQPRNENHGGGNRHH